MFCPTLPCRSLERQAFLHSTSNNAPSLADALEEDIFASSHSDSLDLDGDSEG